MIVLIFFRNYSSLWACKYHLKDCFQVQFSWSHCCWSLVPCRLFVFPFLVLILLAIISMFPAWVMLFLLVVVTCNLKVWIFTTWVANLSICITKFPSREWMVVTTIWTVNFIWFSVFLMVFLLAIKDFLNDGHFYFFAY